MGHHERPEQLIVYSYPPLSILVVVLVLLIAGCATTPDASVKNVEQPAAPTITPAVFEPDAEPTQPAATIPPTAPVTISPVRANPRTITGEKAPSLEFLIEADDYGYYLGEDEIKDIEVKKDIPVEITFRVRSKNVYFGGLDFRSSVFEKQKAGPGQDVTVSFTTNKDVTITSYWPSSNREKAELEVRVG